MKNSILIMILIMLSFFNLNGQSDSLQIHSEIGVRGRWQTGTLNQLAINPNVKLKLSKENVNTEFHADYQYLNVNDFIVNSDFWSSGLYQFKPNRKLYPTAIMRYGFSKSYRIDHSLFTGIGVGLNVRNKSSFDRIQLHSFMGYMNFDYETEDSHSSPAGGILFNMLRPITKHFHLFWELQSYHSATAIDTWGGGNVVSLQYKIRKNISINMTHNTIYNNKTVAFIKNTNTLMLFGISYKYTK